MHGQGVFSQGFRGGLMQRFVRDENDPAGTSAPAVLPINKDAAGANSLSRLLEEVSRTISFAEDASFYVAGPAGNILFASTGYHAMKGPHAASAQIADTILHFVRDNKESYVCDEAMEASQPGAARRYVRSYHYPLSDATGAFLGIAGHYVDTSPQVLAFQQATQDAARKFDQLRASSDLFWEVDARFNLTALSDRASDILGRPAALFIGQALSEIGNFVKRCGDIISPPESFSRHQPFRDVIFLITGADGKAHYFHMSGVPVFAPGDGAFMGFRGVGANVTERFRAEDIAAAALRELEEAKETLVNRNIQLDMERGRAEKALRAKSEFLATMSHELRTPLNAILGFSEAMTMKLFGDLKPQYAGYAGDILKSGQHLLSLIDTMLETARVDGNELSLNIQHIDISALAQKAVSIVQMRAAAKNLDISKAVIPPGWVVKADPLPATQILVNLLSNAVKFTEAGGAIGIEIEATRENGVAMASISVWDTGIGIPAHLQHSVFDKFVRGPNAYVHDDTGQGIGLGLHISKRLASLMQGQLRLYSIPGKGSRFTLDLPLSSKP